MNTSLEVGPSCSVRQLTPDEVMENVQELANLLAPAFAKADCEIDTWSALKLCALGQMQCFVGDVNGIINAAIITTFTQYPLKLVCDVIAYAGEAKNYYWFNEVLDNWALDNGAEEIRGFGDAGSARLARHHGYVEVYRVFKKTLKRKEES